MEFVTEVLGAEPWARQADILRALAREPRITVRSCNNAGKTLCAAWAALWFLCCRPRSIVITTAPTKNQVVNLLWRRLRTAYAGAVKPLGGRCLTAMLELATDWYAQGIATDEEVNFQGPHSSEGVLMIGDEASGLAEWLFQAMQGTMTEAGAKMLLIGNPNVASGYFYNSHLTWPERQRFHISAFDVPEHVLRPDWKDECLRDWGEDNPAYQVRVLGEFPEQGEDSLISLKWIVAAQEREIALRGPIEGGVDIARFGTDESVAYLCQASQVVHTVTWRGNDTMASSGRVAALCADWNPKSVKVDEIGVGAGVLDRLKELKLPVVGINVGEAAFDKEHFANRRSEIFWYLRERFRKGEISIPKNDDLLMAQLVALKFTYTSRGQIKLESKEDMAKRRGTSQGWSSPDRADALAIAFAAGKPVAMGGAMAGPSKGMSDTPLREPMGVGR